MLKAVKLASAKPLPAFLISDFTAARDGINGPLASDRAQYRTSIYVPPMSGVANSEDLYSDHINEKPRHFCRGFPI